MERAENNVVKISGTVESEELTFSHETFGEKFYTFELAIQRLSEEKDIIPIMISEMSLIFSKIRKDEYLYIEGRYHSYREHKHDRNKLMLTVFAKQIWVINPEQKDINSITLQGVISNKVIYRKSPNGREIAELFILVNRFCGKSDYIPIIVWGRNARWAYHHLKVENEVIIEGRIQSRKYYKKISETEVKEKVAYEVSGSRIELVNM